MTSNITEPEWVLIDSLDTSARLRPADATHVDLLATVINETAPITVIRTTRAVADGAMRVDAARLAGHTHVRVVWVDAAEPEAWEAAIAVNARHGLPRSRQDRRRAVDRLLSLAPHWSDRRIATACGVDPKTVGRARAAATHSGAATPHLNTSQRVGRDGRSYPTSAEAQRRRQELAKLRRDEPHLSARATARRAGVAPATVTRAMPLADAETRGAAGGSSARRRHGVLGRARALVHRVRQWWTRLRRRA